MTWLKRLLVGAALIGVGYVFFAEPQLPGRTDPEIDSYSNFAVWIWLPVIIICLLPIAYGFMRADTQERRFLRDSVWMLWLLLTADIVYVCYFILHPINSLFDDAPEDYVSPDESWWFINKYWWEYFFKFYLELTIIALLIGLPAYIYWYRRFFRRNR